MKRRNFVKISAVVAGVLGFSNVGALNKYHAQRRIPGKGYITLKMNDLEMNLFSDGCIRLNNPQPVFAPDIPKAQLSAELRRLHLDETEIEAAISVLVIKKDQKIILIDTGSGHYLGKLSGGLTQSLNDADIKNTDVTNVFITHAHVDHIGGILTAGGELVYPNAKYHIAKKEYDFWMGANPDFSRSKSTDNPQGAISIARYVLKTIANRLEFFDHDEILFSCLKTELADGHTPGHTILTVFSGEKSLKHLVDILHSPLLISRPEWGIEWDVDFYKGIATRKAVLNSVHQNNTLVFNTHLPWPGLGYIEQDGENYQWKPLSYFIPDEIQL